MQRSACKTCNKEHKGFLPLLNSLQQGAWSWVLLSGKLANTSALFITNTSYNSLPCSSLLAIPAQRKTQTVLCLFGLSAFSFSHTSAWFPAAQNMRLQVRVQFLGLIRYKNGFSKITKHKA